MNHNLSVILSVAKNERRDHCKGQSCFDCEFCDTWCKVEKLAWRAIVDKQLLTGTSQNDNCCSIKNEYLQDYEETVNELNEVLRQMREL